MSFWTYMTLYTYRILGHLGPLGLKIKINRNKNLSCYFIKKRLFIWIWISFFFLVHASTLIDLFSLFSVMLHTTINHLINTHQSIIPTRGVTLHVLVLNHFGTGRTVRYRAVHSLQLHVQHVYVMANASQKTELEDPPLSLKSPAWGTLWLSG